MAEEIRLDVVTTAHSRGLKDAERDLRGLRGEADKTGKSFQRTADESFNLDHAIEETRTEIHQLNEEFRRTGDTNLFRHMARQRSELNQMLRIAKEGEEEIRRINSGSGLDFGGAGLRPRNALIAILIGAAVAAAPTVGAILAGAVAGAVGTVGVAGGLAMATRDARVKAEAHRFGRAIADEFFRGGDAFVRPALESMAMLEQAFRDMRVPEAFSKMAPLVTTIADGIGRMGTALMPGLNKAFDRMGPFATVAADGMQQFGEAFGEFLDDVTESEGAVMGLETFFHLINGLILMTGKSLHALSEAYAKVVEVQRNASLGLAGFVAAGGPGSGFMGPRGAGVFAKLGAALDHMMHPVTRMPALATAVAAGMKAAAAGTESFGAAAELTTIATRHLGGALSEAHQEFLTWAGAEISAEAALDRMQAAIDESNGSLNVHTERGRAARLAVLDFAQAAQVAAQAKFDETGSVKQAEQVYEMYRRQLIKTLQAAGMTWREAKRLADQWMGFAKMPNIQKKVTVDANVTPEAAAVMAWWNRKIAETHVTIYADVPKRQHGGPAAAGEIYQVNEAGMEFFRPHTSGDVIPLGRMPAMARRGGGSARPLNITVVGGDDPERDRRLVARISREVQRQGGTLAVIGIR